MPKEPLRPFFPLRGYHQGGSVRNLCTRRLEDQTTGASRWTLRGCPSPPPGQCKSPQARTQQPYVQPSQAPNSLIRVQSSGSCPMMEMKNRYYTCMDDFEVILEPGVHLSVRRNCKENRNFRPKGEGRSGRRPLLPKRKLNILVDLTMGKSYYSVVTFLHAQKIKCYTFSIQTSSKLISYYVCPWKKLNLRFSIFH